MKNQKFNAREFLNVKTLSPLEETQIVGGRDKVKVKVKVKIKTRLTTTL
ncbi:hypothetical protein [Aquimarina sp. MMG016]|nr:hypothetical protein [Aquimarina sp. MMG016]MBQ4819271.1 hypothetical protein [Aquimarina sp. MMG016]